MKVSLVQAILGLFLFSAQELYALESISELQEQLELAIKNNDLKLAESICDKQLTVLPEEDSLERANAWMQHGAILSKSGQTHQGYSEQVLAIQMLNRYTNKKKQKMTESDLKLRDAALKLYEKTNKLEGTEGGEPCNYMNYLQVRIKRRWFPPRYCTGDLPAIKVQFKIHKNGELSDLRVTSSSGFLPADTAALDAVKKASPLRPLPEGCPSPVEIEFTFDYRLFKAQSSGVRQIYPSTTILLSGCN